MRGGLRVKGVSHTVIDVGCRHVESRGVGREVQWKANDGTEKERRKGQWLELYNVEMQEEGLYKMREATIG